MVSCGRLRTWEHRAGSDLIPFVKLVVPALTTARGWGAPEEAWRREGFFTDLPAGDCFHLQELAGLLAFCPDKIYIYNPEFQFLVVVLYLLLFACRVDSYG